MCSWLAKIVNYHGTNIKMYLVRHWYLIIYHAKWCNLRIIIQSIDTRIYVNIGEAIRVRFLCELETYSVHLKREFFSSAYVIIDCVIREINNEARSKTYNLHGDGAYDIIKYCKYVWSKYGIYCSYFIYFYILLFKLL